MAHPNPNWYELDLLQDACSDGDEVTQGIIMELSRGTFLPKHLVECRQRVEQARIQQEKARKESEEAIARAKAASEAETRAFVQEELNQQNVLQRMAAMEEELRVSLSTCRSEVSTVLLIISRHSKRRNVRRTCDRSWHHKPKPLMISRRNL